MINFPKEIGWDNWGGIMCDVELFAPLVREACAAFGYEPAEITAGFPGTNAVFCVDRRYVVKLFAPLNIQDEAAERACYRAIRSANIPLTPTLYAEGILLSGGREWPYIVIDYLPGDAVRETWPGMDAARRQGIGAALGRWAAGYHALANPFDLRSPMADWDPYAQLTKTIAWLREDGRLNSEMIDSIRRFGEKHLQARKRPVLLIHCDLTEDHLLIDGEELRVIDFADSRMAYECLEWAPLWFGLLARDDRAFFAFLEACGHRWNAALRDELLLGVILHNFGAPILMDQLKEDAARVRSVDDIRRWLPKV